MADYEEVLDDGNGPPTASDYEFSADGAFQYNVEDARRVIEHMLEEINIGSPESIQHAASHLDRLTRALAAAAEYGALVYSGFDLIPVTDKAKELVALTEKQQTAAQTVVV